MKNTWIILLGLLMVAGCRTREREGAGKGGAAALNLFPQHHSTSKNLINCKVFIKYNTSDLPTSGVYDDSAICMRQDTLVSGMLSGLKNGNYYIACTGFDTAYHMSIKGGVPYTITSQTSQTVNIPVSE
jgi:hypothetical protein